MLFDFKKYPYQLLLMLTAAFFVSGCVSITERLYDAETDKLCETNGGTFVYEYVTLPAHSFTINGLVSPDVLYVDYGAKSTLSKKAAPYRYEVNSEYIKGDRSSSLAIVKVEQSIIRQSDNFLMGKSIKYGAVRDAHFHPGGHSCPPKKDIANFVFKKDSE